MFWPTNTQQVTIDQSMCLNRRMRKSNCQKCREACPHQGLRVDGSTRDASVTLAVSSCTGCGLCVSACPAGAIALLPKPLNLELKNGTLELVCSKLKPDSSVACLGRVDAYGLAYLGIKAEQVLVGCTDQCGRCSPGVVLAVKASIEKANRILRKLGRRDIQLTVHSGEADKKINRRELFSFCFSLAKETLLELLPLSLSQEKTYRELLIDSINPKVGQVAKLDLSPLFFGGTVKDTCDLCGTCVKSCKSEAITIARQRADGFGQLLHNQSKCMGCKACTVLCPRNALQILTELSDARIIGSRLPVVLASKRCCSRCGQVVADGELVCGQCLHKKTPYLQSVY